MPLYRCGGYRGLDMQTKHIDGAFSVKAVSGAGMFEGFASRFGELDQVGDIVAAGAFSKSLNDHASKGLMPALLWQHDMAEPIGKWHEMRETAEGLEVRGELFVDDIPRAKSAYKLLKEKAISGLSIGYRTKAADMDRSTGVRTLKELDLREVSLVTEPALESARVTSVKAALSAGETLTVREVEAFLRESGFSRKEACHMAAEWKTATQRESGDGSEELVSALKSMAAEMRATLG